MRAAVVDLGLEVANHAAGTYWRLDRRAHRMPVRDVLVIGVYERGSNLPRTIRRLRGSRHNVRFALGCRDAQPDRDLARETVAVEMQAGLFDNTNRLLELGRASGRPPHWTIRIDSDVLVPHRWLDRFIALCELFDLELAGPAYTWRSTVSYVLTRRSLRWLVRETGFVPAGAVVAFRDNVARELMPFPTGIAQGWGLDLHWAQLALERGWRLGLIDVPPVRHETEIGQTYDADLEAQRGSSWLAGRPHRSLAEAATVRSKHRRLP